MFFTSHALSLVHVQVHISKKKKKENYQEELEERIISLIASLFGKKASQNTLCWTCFYKIHSLDIEMAILFFKKKKITKLTQTCLFCFSFCSWPVFFLHVLIGDDLSFPQVEYLEARGGRGCWANFWRMSVKRLIVLWNFIWGILLLINDKYWQQHSLACTTPYISFTLFGAGTPREWRQSQSDWII